MDGKYVDWVRARIRDHGPQPSEPERVQALALAAHNLTKGAGTLFGMHWPESGPAEIEVLRDEALAQLERWFEHLDETNAVEVARFILKHDLRVSVPASVTELLRRVESREGLELPDPPEEAISDMERRIAAAPTPAKTAWLTVQAAAQSTMLGLQRLEWPFDPFMAEPPAAAFHLASLQAALGMSLPTEFVYVMGIWARTAYFTWGSPPEAQTAVSEGGVEDGLWNLGRVHQLKAQCDVWRDVHNAPGSDDDRRWSCALPFAHHEGLYLALAVTNNPNAAPVVALHRDQDPSQGHGLRLGASFIPFLITWAELGFPFGPIDVWKPFLGSNGLSDQTPAASRWRSFLRDQ